MLFHADSAHMLGMNVLLKRLVLQRGKTKALERLRLYFGRFRGGSNGVVDRSSYAPDFQFPLRINVKISEHAPNFNVFKPRLVCGRILILPSGSSGNSPKI